MFPLRWFDAVVSRFGWTTRTVGRGRRRLTLRKWVRWPNVARSLGVLQLEDRTVPATITFANPLGGDWNTGANWVGGVTPSATDDAVIPDLPGTPSVTFSGDTSVNSVVSAERISAVGWSWTIAAASSLNAGLALSAGSHVIVTGGVLTLAGASSWADGDFYGAGSERQTGTMTLTAGNHSVHNTFLNEGTLAQTAGTLYLGDATSAFVNAAGGTHTLSGTAAEYAVSAANGGTYTNQGLLQRTAGASTLVLGGPVANQGTVSTLTGALDFRDSAAHAGTFATSAGATLLFSNGTATLAAGAAFTGAGAVTLSGGSFAVTGDVSANNLSLASVFSTAAVAAGKTLTLTGAGTWSDGTFAGAGTVRNTGTLTVTGTTARSLSATLANDSVVSVTGASTIDLGTTGRIQNAHILELSNGSGTPTLTGSAGFDQVVNSDTLLVSGAGATIVARLSNTGNLGSNSGTLVVSGAVAQISGGTLTGGTWTIGGTLTVTSGSDITTVGPAASVNLGGTFNRLSAVAVNQGRLFFNRSFTTAGPLTNSGTLAESAGSNGVLTVTGAYTQTAGLTQLFSPTDTLAASGGVFLSGGTLAGTGTVQANLSNTGGTVAPGFSPGILNVTGNYTQGAGGTLAI